MAKSEPLSVRIEEEDLEWFHRTFPWRGSFQSFVDECIRELRKAWGDAPGPAQIVPKVVRRAVTSGF